MVLPKIRGPNLVTKYVFLGVYCVITNQELYMDDEIFMRLVKVVSPSIRKMKLGDVSFVCLILFSLFITPHICSSKLSPYIK